MCSAALVSAEMKLLYLAIICILLPVRLPVKSILLFVSANFLFQKLFFCTNYTFNPVYVACLE